MGARPELLLHDSLLGSAKAAPGRDAVVDESGSWTYEELADEALRIARFLQDQGLQEGDRVALCLDNTARCAAGIFGDAHRRRCLHRRQPADESGAGSH